MDEIDSLASQFTPGDVEKVMRDLDKIISRGVPNDERRLDQMMAAGLVMGYFQRLHRLAYEQARQNSER